MMEIEFITNIGVRNTTPEFENISVACKYAMTPIKKSVCDPIEYLAMKRIPLE